jgi:hypothetical protein
MVLAAASALGLGAMGLGVLVGAGCGAEGPVAECPEDTEELTAQEVDLYRQLEVCASRVTGVELYREELPRVEAEPELVACDKNPTGTCVTTPAGQAVTGYYLPDCDTFTVVVREVIYHEAVHAILCGVPGTSCDPGHQSPVWQECQTIKQCPDGRLLLVERVCDGTPDCAQGEDELGCP